ncbi:hypothetical protein HX049_13600 [Myroides odoratimimus]|uniref:hypothetical protein n=1 Tax=Myroides odoratimimus TaxID=76832 RepID=UPI0025772E6F|nr:hypothetical protein [Myroides odoratimimus]MDM1398202.1 hypothetical protein [Myroides odoratimimus]
MKTLIKNLLMPLAVFAMLTVGAFTINASEKIDHAVNTESVTEFQVADPYLGDHYIEILDPITNEYVFTKVEGVVEGECTLTVGTVRCTIEIDNEDYDLWGESPLGGYAPLYKL